MTSAREHLSFLLDDAFSSGADTDFTELDRHEIVDLADSGRWSELAKVLDRARDLRLEAPRMAVNLLLEELAWSSGANPTPDPVPADGLLDEIDACGCLCGVCDDKLAIWRSRSVQQSVQTWDGPHEKPEEPGFYYVELQNDEHVLLGGNRRIVAVGRNFRSEHLGFFDECESKPVFIDIHSNRIVQWGPKIPEWTYKKGDQWTTCHG